jgi:hypothetical protein
VGYDQNDIKAAVKKIIKDEGLQIHVVQVRRFGPRALGSSTQVKRRVVTTWPRSSS